MNYHFNKDFTFIHTEEKNGLAVDIFKNNKTKKYFIDKSGKQFEKIKDLIKHSQKILSIYNQKK